MGSVHTFGYLSSYLITFGYPWLLLTKVDYIALPLFTVYLYSYSWLLLVTMYCYCSHMIRLHYMWLCSYLGLLVIEILTCVLTSSCVLSCIFVYSNVVLFLCSWSRSLGIFCPVLVAIGSLVCESPKCELVSHKRCYTAFFFGLKVGIAKRT